MKFIICLLVCTATTLVSFSQSVGVGTNTPHSSAALEVQSTTQGMLIPRMTSAQRNLIAAAQGLLVYDTDTNTFWFYNNSAWVNLTPSAFALPYFDEGSAAVPTLTIRNNGSSAGIRGMGVTGPGLWGVGSGGGLVGSAIRAENSHSAGIGLYSITNSIDANTVLANPGTGDLLRGFSGPSAGNLVYRILNNGSLLTSGRIGIGTGTVPATSLEINGSMRFNNGNQAIGRVLTSDGNGVANWLEPYNPAAFTAFYAAKTGNPITHQFWDGSVPMATVTYPAEYDDRGNNYNPSTSEYTIPQTGYYHFYASVNYQGGSGTAMLRFIQDGSSVISSKVQGITSSDFGIDITHDGYFVTGTKISIMGSIPNACAWRQTSSFSGWRLY